MYFTIENPRRQPWDHLILAPLPITTLHAVVFLGCVWDNTTQLSFQQLMRTLSAKGLIRHNCICFKILLFILYMTCHQVISPSIIIETMPKFTDNLSVLLPIRLKQKKIIIFTRKEYETIKTNVWNRLLRFITSELQALSNTENEDFLLRFLAKENMEKATNS